mmetsp:Transcript_17825/g.44128  ORF Transcript_17825/g.44128 Transcript_17825/m.44128 type:complete len:343 (-) Transcript_17825:141-1169(-)
MRSRWLASPHAVMARSARPACFPDICTAAVTHTGAAAPYPTSAARQRAAALNAERLVSFSAGVNTRNAITAPQSADCTSAPLLPCASFTAAAQASEAAPPNAVAQNAAAAAAGGACMDSEANALLPALLLLHDVASTAAMKPIAGSAAPRVDHSTQAQPAAAVQKTRRANAKAGGRSGDAPRSFCCEKCLFSWSGGGTGAPPSPAEEEAAAAAPAATRAKGGTEKKERRRRTRVVKGVAKGAAVRAGYTASAPAAPSVAAAAAGRSLLALVACPLDDCWAGGPRIVVDEALEALKVRRARALVVAVVDAAGKRAIDATHGAIGKRRVSARTRNLPPSLPMMF